MLFLIALLPVLTPARNLRLLYIWGGSPSGLERQIQLLRQALSKCPDAIQPREKARRHLRLALGILVLRVDALHMNQPGCVEHSAQV